jgi:protein TonB
LEQEAKFPGSRAAWKQFLRQNLKADMPLEDKWATGTYTVIVKFVVAKDGSVSNVVTENYTNSKTSQMCVDLIKSGPKWVPGSQKNAVVRSYRKQPITFVKK